MPKGSFYNHFESKEALGAEVVDIISSPAHVSTGVGEVSLGPATGAIGNAVAPHSPIHPFSLQLLSQPPCPKCQGQARAEWLAARQAELLPVPYFHVVFTLPAPLAEIAFQNKETVYAILFRSAAETLRTIAADPRHLGAEIGLLAVLHTWGCVVPGGGPSLDGTRWIACRPGFFLPVRVLSRLFRRLFLDELRAAFEAGELRFFGELAGLADPTAFARHLNSLRQVEWVVYAKPPFGGPKQVLAYLSRYTHRVAIANSRLVSLTDTAVAFRWKILWGGG